MLSRVYIPGVWDLLHVGHIEALQNAKALGDVLIVGVPSDEVVVEDKGQPPIIPLYQRIMMLDAVKCVDMVVAYYDLEFKTHLDMLRPHVLAVGAQWGKDKRHKEAELWTKVNGADFVKLPYCKEQSTTDIKNKVVEQYACRIS